MHRKEAPKATCHSDKLWCWQLASQGNAGSDQQQPPHGKASQVAHCSCPTAPPPLGGREKPRNIPTPALMETNLLPSPAKNGSLSGSPVLHFHKMAPGNARENWGQKVSTGVKQLWLLGKIWELNLGQI